MGPHPYESIPLNIAGYVLGAYLLVVHGLMVWKAERCKEWLNRLPRHRAVGFCVMLGTILEIFLERTIRSELIIVNHFGRPG